ncbi:hypothetical protein U879_10245 [Defluviimonas sp. 20V17]|uniref:DUF3572 domain-containing protein n=1 Tax=Allgaiera indica TaxID=765699 RepID=A0AAN4UPP9_9RHOB|nr:DUF3572 domain-containing protein [Allgaiera indica]KDB03758.1 hypothetical protein U879_10245 [Defluviimonas sp. 20V17]GHD99995.1 hypothetical protein GCM10008024_09940 [Allgaiera indica]SDW39125.1 Protein of unknown function [Allgaiera indica]
MITRESAETLGLRALGWLASQDDLLQTFLGATGADVSEIRECAGDPSFLGAVLDFLLMDDAWIMAFCDAEGLAYDTPLAARQILPGGAQTHWT